MESNATNLNQAEIINAPTEAMNGLFDIADVAEQMVAASEDDTLREPSLKKQRQDSPPRALRTEYAQAETTSHEYLEKSLPAEVPAHLPEKSNNSPPEHKHYPLKKRLLQGTMSTTVSVEQTPPSPQFTQSHQPAQRTPPTPQTHQNHVTPARLPQSQANAHNGHSTPHATGDHGAIHPSTSPLVEVDVVSCGEDQEVASARSTSPKFPRNPITPISVTAPIAPTKVPLFEEQISLSELPPRRKKPSVPTPTTKIEATPRSPRGGGGAGRGRGIAGRGRGGAVRPKQEERTYVRNAGANEKTYCFCQRVYDPSVDVFMICCDMCDEWYHGACVNVTQKDAKKITRYICPRCHRQSADQRSNGDVVKSKPEHDPEHPPNAYPLKRPVMSAVPPTMKPANLSEQVPSPTDKKCPYQYCSNMAKPGSKYCSDECGILYAKEQMAKTKPPVPHVEETHVVVNLEAQSAADAADLAVLKGIADKKLLLDEKVRKLDADREQLSQAIQFATQLNQGPVNTSSPIIPDSQEPSNGDSEAHEDTHSSTQAAGADTMDCVTCGLPIAANKFSFHLARCFKKKDSNFALPGLKRRRLNQDNDQALCGCPTVDSPSSYCEVQRKMCVKHINWETMRMASLEQERTCHEQMRQKLQAEEALIHQNMARRRQTSSDANRTILHNAEPTTPSS